MKRVLILLSVLGLLVGACGSDDKKSDDAKATTTTAAKANDKDETEAGYADKLLTAADLPAGFPKGDVSEENGSVGDDSDAFCKSLSTTQKDNPPNHEAEVDFDKTDDSGINSILVIEAVSRYDTTALATKAAEGLRGAFTSCKTFSQEEDGATLAGGFAPYELKTAAEDSFAEKLTASQSAEGVSLPFNGYFVVQRKGTIVCLIGVIQTGSASYPEDGIKPLAEKALAKL